METIDTLFNDSLQLVQAASGYRFSLDPILLADFVCTDGCFNALDLGAGCGILSLLLARKHPFLSITGWEFQAQMVERAGRSVLLNGFSETVTIVEADVRCFRKLVKAGQVDLVATNPPYRLPGNGRISPGDERAAARHELNGGLAEFLAAASWAIKNRGRFAIVYLAERLSELLVGMTAVGIEPKRLRMVHPRPLESARMVLVEGVKGGKPGLKIEPPLYIYKGDDGNRDYTDEVMRIYAD